MAKTKLTIAGYRALQKPRVNFDSFRMSIGTGKVEFILNEKVVAELDNKVGFFPGDTFTINDINGYLEIELKDA